ncbi:O-linked N-acetylglucosamine transferase, SPINDLY family protein [Geminocystis herdmanii]|uniref:O-linked N-acetylglucosamine transferase, SPINDLY family protein n=1 Tax=Geminocystis herdmanii TaxID=669359 RepID=UPI00034AF60B|nr:glycosyltransferase family 41 protein [Geminocystis herdmanii]
MNQWHPSVEKYWENKNYEEVIKIYEDIINNNPTEITNYFYLGLAYLMKGEIDTAQSIWMSVLLEADNFQDELKNLLQVLHQQGKKQLATGTLKSALIIYQTLEELLTNREEFTSNEAISYHAIGFVYKMHKQLIEAEKCFQLAIDIGQIKEAYNDLGGMYFDGGIMEKAIEVYRREINDHPDYTFGYVNLLAALHKSGNITEAINTANLAQEKFSDDLLWKIRNYLILPLVYQNEEEIMIFRQRFIDGLQKIVDEVENLDLKNQEVRKKALLTFKNNVNFELAYQKFNHKELQQKYGNLIYKVVSANYPDYVQPKEKKPVKSRKIKVGYVSQCMCKHVVSRLMLGWLRHHDPTQFEIYSYYIGFTSDELTQEYEQYSDFFYHIDGFETASKKIMADDLDIVVFLEIGMSPYMAMLGSLRFAPVQCTTWGHPETSGLRNVDYFLSSDLMEPENGQEHYSENLVRLPNIGISYPKPALIEVPKNRDFFRLPADALIYFCGQSVFKYLPENDHILAAIAQRVPNSKFLFLTRPNPNIAEQFKQRLSKAFADLGLNLEEYGIFLPLLTKNDYLNLNLLSDVFLDSFGWSGGSTTLEAITYNLPVVTYPGEFMRGRHSYGILKMLGVTDTIASSPQEYIDIAVRLGNDQLWREEIKEKIKANYHNLYDDLDCVRGLEKFYQDVCL